MQTLSKARVVVVGAGALGSACALVAARAGGRVTVVDTAPIAVNASGIAAGMLAPAFESVLDPASAGQFTPLAQARDRWPSFAEGLGPTGLDQCGALLRAPSPTVERVREALAAQGARTDDTRAGLFTPEDWRLEPRLALAALRQGLIDLGGAVLKAQVVGLEPGAVILGGGDRLTADAVILACGFGGQTLCAELAVLTPIKGQLLRFDGHGPHDGPIARTEASYLAPGRDGAVVGATMEPGRYDLDIDPEATLRLKAEAARLSPSLAWATPQPLTGIRAASPDGWPLVGPSAQPGVWLAAGARRNGWLLAPLAAELLVQQLGGGEGGAWETAAFAPDRFPITSAGHERDGNANL